MPLLQTVPNRQRDYKSQARLCIKEIRRRSKPCTSRLSGAGAKPQYTDWPAAGADFAILVGIYAETGSLSAS